MPRISPITLSALITLTYLLCETSGNPFLLQSSKISTMALNFSSLPLEKKSLFKPNLTEVRDALSQGLKSTFEYVNVEVVDCPDLSTAPFNLASTGIGGKSVIVDLGGPPYLLPLVQKEKVYDLKDLPSCVDVEPALIIGAGAGPFPFAGMNCEGVYNMKVSNGTVEQKSVIGILKEPHAQEYSQKFLPASETRCALLANLYVTQGLPGQVLKVHTKIRKGSMDFVTSIRSALNATYRNEFVGLGGAFLIKNGKVKQHIMDDFSKTPIYTDEEVNNWLHFYEMSTPLVAVGTLMSADPDMDLRIQHFHSYSDHNEAGHYHIDVTPKEIEYLGYFNIADSIVRIDKPENTHQVGRD